MDKTEDTPLQTYMFSPGWVACMQPPGKGRAFPSPLRAQRPARWNSLPGPPRRVPTELQPHRATSGQRQPAPLLHRCPGVHCPHCWAFGPCRKSNRYFCGQIFALLKRFECRGMKDTLFLLLWTQTEAKAGFRERVTKHPATKDHAPQQGPQEQGGPRPSHWTLGAGAPAGTELPEDL